MDCGLRVVGWTSKTVNIVQQALCRRDRREVLVSVRSYVSAENGNKCFKMWVCVSAIRYGGSCRLSSVEVVVDGTAGGIEHHNPTSTTNCLLPTARCVPQTITACKKGEALFQNVTLLVPSYPVRECFSQRSHRARTKQRSSRSTSQAPNSQDGKIASCLPKTAMLPSSSPLVPRCCQSHVERITSYITHVR
jgi:hypothetical protein